MIDDISYNKAIAGVRHSDKIDQRAPAPCHGVRRCSATAGDQNMSITINCDMGEAFGIYRLGDDEACMPFITHANVACGFHASDPIVMRETVRAAKRHGVATGAHPRRPDPHASARRDMKLSSDDVTPL